MKKLVRTGQIISTVVLVYFLFMVGGEFISFLMGEQPTTPWSWESVGILIFITSALVFVIWAWKDYKKGRWALLGLGMAFMIFAGISAGYNQFFAAMVSGFPYALSGLLMLVDSDRR